MLFRSQPKLLILDEPTNGLDPDGVIGFRELLKKFATESGVSILIASHILSELDKMCTKILFIKDGELVDGENINKNKELQNVILTVENPQEIFERIQEIDFIYKIEIVNNNVIIQINRSNTSKLLSELGEKDIKYSNIEIENNNIEKIYRDIYLGGNSE